MAYYALFLASFIAICPISLATIVLLPHSDIVILDLGADLDKPADFEYPFGILDKTSYFFNSLTFK